MRQALPSFLSLGLPVALLVLLLAPASRAQSSLDDFESGANLGGWSFGVTTGDVIEPSGGNPGRWLHNPLIDSFAPILRGGGGSPFTGDWRGQGVVHFAVDAQTLAVDFSAAGRPLTLLLRVTHGTPSVADDDFAYFPGPQVPQPGQGWVRYGYAIPSAFTGALPAGWTGGSGGDPEHFAPGVDWNDVITQVDQVELWWIHPAFFGIFQQWNVGVDNLRLTRADGEGIGCDASSLACPCGNAGLPGSGCDNPQATGGVQLALSAFAPDLAGGGTATLQGLNFPPSTSPTAIVLRSGGSPIAPSAFGDGLLCLPTPLVRLAAANASGGTSTHALTHGAGAGTFSYQLWYRSAPAGFCTPAAFNASSSLTLLWP